jgi:hypothetical protein
LLSLLFGRLNCNYVYALLLWGLLLVSTSRYSVKVRRMSNLPTLIFKSAWGTGVKHNADCFHDTGLPSQEVFMLLDKAKIKATNKMRLKHKFWPEASKIIVPNLHSTLISVPKMADADYIAVFDKKEARIYDAMTNIVSATKDSMVFNFPGCT